MPRTQHLNHLTPNRIYAIDAQVRYTHSTPNMTTAVIQQENSQSLIKIPRSQNVNISEGASYHFGFCFIGRNGWISARHPDHSIQQSHEPIIQEPLGLGQIAGNMQELNGHYLTTVLQVIRVNPPQNVLKDGRQLTICVLNCFGNGLLVDVTLWNTNVDATMEGQWVVFSGFRMKKLVQSKFVLVSSVYSNMSPFVGNLGLLFSPEEVYPNLSSVFTVRNTREIQQETQEKEKVYSELKAVINGIEVKSYEGCSVCRKKLAYGEVCRCNPSSELKEFTIMKLALGDGKGWLEAAVFDPEIQVNLSKLNGPAQFMFRIKSTSKMVEQEIKTSHIISKVESL